MILIATVEAKWNKVGESTLQIMVDQTEFSISKDFILIYKLLIWMFLILSILIKDAEYGIIEKEIHIFHE